MRILFINAVNLKRAQDVEDRTPPLGTQYLASYLRKYGSFNNIQIVSTGQVSEQLLKGADLVGVSSVTQNFNAAMKICVDVKRIADVPVIMGGFHISMMPNNLTPEMDVGVIGEGEETMLELANMLESIGLNKTHLSKTNGVVFWNNGKLEITPKRDLISPLDKIPFPARDLVTINKTFPPNLATSRGCPYNCVFCSSAAFWRGIRYFSAEYVVAEMREIWQRYHVKRVGLVDDLFASNVTRLRRIVELAEHEQFFGKLRMLCTARANLVNREVATLLKRLGVYRVSMGLESGSERILKYLKCGSVTLAQNYEAIDTLADAKLKVSATFIIGSPTETKAEMMETLKLARYHRLATAQAFVLVPLPKTPVWNEAGKNGKVCDTMDWDDFSMFFSEKPDSRAFVSEFSRRDMLQILRMFDRMSLRKKVWQMVTTGTRHPRLTYEFVSMRLRKKVGRLLQRDGM